MIHKKKAVSETQNYSKAHTETPPHTQLLAYQISKKGKVDQSKHNPGKRNKAPYKNKSDQDKIHLYWK